MQCPNCGQETVNINGRNVCLDCGIEVSSESNLSQQATPSVNTDVVEKQNNSEDTVVPSFPPSNTVSEEVSSPVVPPVASTLEPASVPVPAEPSAVIPDVQKTPEAPKENEVTEVIPLSTGESPEAAPLNNPVAEEAPQPQPIRNDIQTNVSEGSEPTVSDMTAPQSQIPVETAPETDESIPVQTENPFEHDVPVDSGRPLYEEKNEPQTPQFHENEVAHSYLAANNIDTVKPSNSPNDIMANSSIPEPSVNSDLNVFQSYTEESQSEFMQANPISNGTIKKVIVTTSILFVSFILILTIFLKKDSILSLFGVQKIQELDSPEKQPFDKKGDGESMGKIQ